MDAKQRERLIGVRFNKKLHYFLDAIWRHKDLAHDFLVADGIDEVEQLDEDEMHVEYKDMDMNEDVYGDLMNGDDDDNDDDDGDPYNTSEDDNDDDDVYMPIEDDHYQALKSTTSLRKAESLASLAELVFGLSLALYTERLTNSQLNSTVLIYFSA
ncbi:hypothetical protein IWW34DRAFT_874998 [Fusarium oxysporum f. sp. albedinis]|nr:hypothetical protein IWW34DRAFT_874998 [Fusarium oxysporum f. sp. albedinis]